MLCPRQTFNETEVLGHLIRAMVALVQALYRRLHLEEVVPKAVLEEKTTVILYGLKILYYASPRPDSNAGGVEGGQTRRGGIMWHRDTVRFLMRLVASFMVMEHGYTDLLGGGGRRGWERSRVVSWSRLAP